MLRIAFIAISITACAGATAYKVRDENGWPVNQFDAANGELLAISCPSMPRAHYLSEGTRTPVVLDHELGTALYAKFCAKKTRGEQLIALTSEHSKDFADKLPTIGNTPRPKFRAHSKTDRSMPEVR